MENPVIVKFDNVNVSVGQHNVSGIVYEYNDERIVIMTPAGLHSALLSECKIKVINNEDNPGDFVPHYHAAPVKRLYDDTYEPVCEPFTEEKINEISMWSVYEGQPDGTTLVIADFLGDNDADDAKAFADLKNSQNK